MTELYQSPVRFVEDTHQYFLGERELKGITSTLIRRAYPNKYKNINADVLAQAAAKGHALHVAIECYDEFGGDPDEAADDRVRLYADLKQERGFVTVANEYLVSDEEHYASSIDIVVSDTNGDVCLLDIKSTWTLDIQSTALQLSIYKRWFERQNPTLKVGHIYALWLPNKDHRVCQLHELSVVSDETIDSLIAADLADVPFDITATYGNLPTAVHNAEEEIVRIETLLKEYKERQDLLKKGLYDLMERYDIKQFEGTKIKLTRILPTTSETFDTKAFKDAMPDLYKQYVKLSRRAGSLKITIVDD